MDKKELAKELGVSPRTLWRWIDKGMPHVMEYKGLRPIMKFDIEQVKEWLKQQRGG